MTAIDPLGLTAAQYSAAANWAAVVVLGATLIVVYRQLREAARLRWERSRPYVIVSIATRQQLAMVRVENLGSTAARNIRLTFVGEEPQSEDRLLRWKARGLWSPAGMPVMAPGQRLDFALDVLTRRNEDTMAMAWTVRATYDDTTGRHIPPEDFRLDLVPFMQSLVPVDHTRDLAKSAETIQKLMNRWSDGHRGIRVQVDHRRRERAREHRPWRLTRVKRVQEEEGYRAAARSLWQAWRQRQGLYIE